MSEIRVSGASNEVVTINATVSEALVTDTRPSETAVSGLRSSLRRSRPDRADPPGARARSRRGRREDDHEQILATYERHHRDLVRFAAMVAPEPGMAEDLVQEAFVKLYSAWRRIDNPGRVGGYLRSTVLNLARGRARHLGVIRRNRPEPSPDAASAESRAIVNDDRGRVVAALRRLSDRQRACLVLRHYEDRSESEIAEILDISIGSVRTHVHRGMQALTAMLEEEARS